jgi:imidazolonepropionase-like amidohydrolase
MLIEPGTPAQEGIDPQEHTPAAVVTRMKAAGVICVKTFFERGFGGMHGLPVPKAATIRELVQAAHAAGLPVLMHANSTEAQAFAVETGVDIIAHGLWNWSEPAAENEIMGTNKKILDDELAHDIDGTNSADAKAAEAAANHFFGATIEHVEHATAYLAARNGRLLFGTDTPSAPTYAKPPGLNGWLEMQHLVHAGVTPAQIFQAATLANARALKLDQDIGTVEVGKKANLLLLGADPTRSIQAYAHIEKVILGGQVLDPANLRADRPH